MIVLNFRSEEFQPGAGRRSRTFVSMRNRGFLLTVYKRACILPPEYLEEGRDRTEIRPFAEDA
jgi:hypothetical protein